MSSDTKGESESESDHHHIAGPTEGSVMVGVKYFVMDANGKEQGPFSFEHVRNWILAGYFSGYIQSRRVVSEQQAREGKDEDVSKHNNKSVMGGAQGVENEKRDEKKEFGDEKNDHSSVSRPEAGATTSRLKSSTSFADLSSFPEFASSFEYVAQYRTSVLSSLPSERMVGDSSPSSSSSTGDYTTTGSFKSRTGKFQAQGQGQSNEEHFSSRGIPTDKAGRQIAVFMNPDNMQKQAMLRKHLKPTLKLPKGTSWKDMKARKKKLKFMERMGNE